MAGSIVARLSLLTDSFQRGLNDADRGLQQFSRKARQTGLEMVAIGTALAAPIVLFGKAALDASVEFESAFTGVRKTVDATEEEFDKLEKTFRRMSTHIPVSAVELSKIGEIAGQLGVRGVDNLTKFTDTIARISVTTNLTSEQAATAFARISNVLQVPISEVDRLGSAVVELGNNFAANEQEIVEFAQRLKSAGATVGLSTADVLGLSTALAAVGVNAEAGGTAASKMLLRMSSAAAEGGEAARAYAEVMGQTNDEFIQLVNNSPAEAFTVLIEKFGQLSKPELLRTLTELNIKEVRLRNTTLALAKSGDVLRESIDAANRGYTENLALLKESEIRFATTESKLILLNQIWTDFNVTIGNVFKTSIADAAVGIGEFIVSITDWIKENKKLVEGITAAAAVIAGLGAMIATGGVFALALAGLGVAGGPVALAIAGIAALVALFVSFRDEIAGFTVPLIIDLQTEFAVLSEKIKSFFSGGDEKGLEMRLRIIRHEAEQTKQAFDAWLKGKNKPKASTVTSAPVSDEDVEQLGPVNVIDDPIRNLRSAALSRDTGFNVDVRLFQEANGIKTREEAEEKLFELRLQLTRQIAQAEEKLELERLAREGRTQEELGQVIVDNAKRRFEFEAVERKKFAQAEEELGQVILDNAKRRWAYEESERKRLAALPGIQAQGNLDRVQARGGNRFEVAQAKIKTLQAEMQRLSTEPLITDEQRERVKTLAVQIQELNKVTKPLPQLWLDIRDAVTGSLRQMLTGVLRGTQSIGDAFKNMAVNILASLTELFASRAIVQLFDLVGGGLFGSGPRSSSGGIFSGLLGAASGSFLGGLFGFANGGVMSPNGPMRLQSFAGGGVASSPTLAMFGEGGGSEAFVPLPDGRRIPVNLQGGGTKVIVNNNTQEPATVTRKSNGGGGEDIMVTVGRSLGRQVRERGPLGKDIAAAFGLKFPGGVS